MKDPESGREPPAIVEEFTVEIPQPEVDDLRSRLIGTRWEEPALDEGWAYGVSLPWMREMVEYWIDGFDWRRAEQRMNLFRQRRATIDGHVVHFLQVDGVGPAPTPMLLGHGWPWTFWDWHEVIGPLTDPASHGGDPRDAVTLVIPSLPGTAFSTPLPRPIGPLDTARLWRTLMTEVLGHERYAIGGGGWGALIASLVGNLYPEELIGVWSMFPVMPGLPVISAESFAEDESWMWERMEAEKRRTSRHGAIAATEPQTLAFGLIDSPIATAAWTWGRRYLGSDHDGDLLSVFDREFLCTSASLLWLTKTAGTSMRIYREADLESSFATPPRLGGPRVIDAPTGFAVFPRDMLFIPRRVADDLTDLRRWTVLPRGGNYAPMEQPDAVIQEIREFLRPL